MENLKNMSLEELQALKSEIEKEIASRNSQKYILHLSYHHFKGSGKCWLANIDPTTKKILSFVNAESVQKDDNHKGSKTFALMDGYYLSCESGTKSTDRRQYFKIENGEYMEM